MFANGKQDLGEMLEGYIYLRWPSLYIYHLRNIVADLVNQAAPPRTA